eukprot:scpid65853/ scgid17717/ Ras-related protein Rab-8B; Ras-related protein Rab-8B
MAHDRSYDYSFKLLVVGDSGVGKTCMILRHVEQQFAASYISTIGIDSKVKIMNLDGLKIRLQIWDTAGQERFRTLTSAYYRGAMGVLLLYDMTNSKTFDNVRDWLQNIDDHASPDVIKVLVGNKKDLVDTREVETARARDLAATHGIPFFESSAKSGENVDECFLAAAKLIYELRRKQEKRTVFDSPSSGGTVSRQPSTIRVEAARAGNQQQDGGGCSC